MPAGLQVFNDSGIVQIDGTYSNLQLTAKGTASTSMQNLSYFTQANGTFRYNTPYTTVSFTGNTPVFAVSGDSTVSVVSTSVSGSVWTVGIITPNGPASFEWYVFDEASSSGGNYGLQVFNDSGVLVFDSSNKYFRQIGYVFGVVPTYSANNVNGYTNPVTYLYSFPGKKCAVACMLSPVNYGNVKWDSGTNTIPDNPNCRAFGFGGFRGSTNGVYFDFVHTILSYQGYYDGGVNGWVFPYTSSVEGGDFGLKQYGGIIIDVTNY